MRCKVVGTLNDIFVSADHSRWALLEEQKPNGRFFRYATLYIDSDTQMEYVHVKGYLVPIETAEQVVGVCSADAVPWMYYRPNTLIYKGMTFQLMAHGNIRVTSDDKKYSEVFEYGKDTFAKATSWIWNMADNTDIATEFCHRICRKYHCDVYGNSYGGEYER